MLVQQLHDQLRKRLLSKRFSIKTLWRVKQQNHVIVAHKRHLSRIAVRVTQRPMLLSSGHSVAPFPIVARRFAKCFLFAHLNSFLADHRPTNRLKQHGSRRVSGLTCCVNTVTQEASSALSREMKVASRRTRDYVHKTSVRSHPTPTISGYPPQSTNADRSTFHLEPLLTHPYAGTDHSSTVSIYRYSWFVLYILHMRTNFVSFVVKFHSPLTTHPFPTPRLRASA